jgi:hypothetical protein
MLTLNKVRLIDAECINPDPLGKKLWQLPRGTQKVTQVLMSPYLFPV